MGSLAAELLFDCRETKAHLRGIKISLWFLLAHLYDALSELTLARRLLGEVITHGNDETLKLVAGMIIREMLVDGVPASEFWHAGIDSAAYRRFPSDKNSATQWVKDIMAFVDALGSQKILTQK